MTWHKKSRAISDDLISELPEEYYCLHDGEGLAGSSFDKDDVLEETSELGDTWEFASYVRAGLASSRGNGDSKFYHFDLPKSLYPVFSIETGKIEGVYTAYDGANSQAVDAGDDYRFCQYIRYDRTFIRTYSENEKQDRRDDAMGVMNIAGDKIDPIERMSPKVFEAYKDETDRPEATLS